MRRIRMVEVAQTMMDRMTMTFRSRLTMSTGGSYPLLGLATQRELF